MDQSIQFPSFNFLLTVNGPRNGPGPDHGDRETGKLNVRKLTRRPGSGTFGSWREDQEVERSEAGEKTRKLNVQTRATLKWRPQERP
jgi:hypothetical protein